MKKKFWALTSALALTVCSMGLAGCPSEDDDIDSIDDLDFSRVAVEETTHA